MKVRFKQSRVDELEGASFSSIALYK